MGKKWLKWPLFLPKRYLNSVFCHYFMYTQVVHHKKPWKLEKFQDFWKYGAILSQFSLKSDIGELQIAKTGISPFSLRLLLWRSYEAENWPQCAPIWGKKFLKMDFRIFAFFQNGGHFCRENGLFGKKMWLTGRHFEKSENSKIHLLRFFAPYRGTLWPIFSFIAPPEQKP